MAPCASYTIVQNLLDTFDDTHEWIESLESVDLSQVEGSILDYVRHVSGDILQASQSARGGREQTVSVKQAVPERSYVEEFPSLGSCLEDTKKKSILEARIASPSGGEMVQTVSHKVSKRRIVPTAVTSVHVDETFVGSGSVENGLMMERILVEKKKHTAVQEDVVCTPDQNGKGFSRISIGDLTERFGGSLGFESLDSPVDVKSPDTVVEETHVGGWLQGLAILHGRVLERSPRIYLLSEIRFLFELLVVDPRVRIDGEEGMTCGMDAVVYAGTVLQHSGDLLYGLGRETLEDLSDYLSNVALKSKVLRLLKKKVSGALLGQEPMSLLAHSPSLGRVQTSGPLLGLTGLNVFLSDSSGAVSRSSEDQKRLSNREAFRDTWFKLMREAVHRSSSLDALQQHKGSSKGGSNAVSEERHGDVVVLKILQEDSGQILRGLRVDNYEPFAELFTAAVLQAAVTGETLMDEELTGIAKQNLSRFESLNKRFQTTSNTKGAAPPRRSQQKSGLMPRKGHIDHSAEHALRISGEFAKPLRPFVLFLEATDSQRLNISIVKTMRAKLMSLLTSSSKSQSLNNAGLLSLEELCISTTSLAGFLGYFSFTKGQSVMKDSPSLQRVQEDGDFDGSHSLDVLNALQQCIPSFDDMSSTPGNFFRYIPWVCRYLKFLAWNRELCSMPYFQRLFDMLQEIRCHHLLRPTSREFRGVAALCLRGILDNICWYFEPELESFRGSKVSTEQKNMGELESALRDDIQWANTVLGRRYVEMTCPDISYLQALISPAKAHGQELKPRKKIRPTVPVHTETVSSPLSTGSLQRARDPAEAKKTKQEHILEELERVFLDQYSNGSVVTDVKLRDFVTWCSDAVARKGVSAGLEQLSHQCHDDISKAIKDRIIRLKQEGIIQNQRMEKQRMQLATRGLQDQFSDRYYRALQAESIAALRDAINQCSKQSAEMLLPDSWGRHVKMTAAAIIARRAESAGSRQLLSELKKVALSRTKKEIESLIY